MTGDRALPNPAEIKAWLWPERPEYSPTTGRRAYLLVIYTLRRWNGDGCPSLASSLALQTLLSVVPLAGVLLSVLRLIDPDLGREFLGRLLATLSPASASRTREFTNTLFELGNNISVAQIGVWGFAAVVLLAYFLFATMERTFNRIWQNSRRRRAITKFTTFYTLATLFPVVIFYSLAQPVLEPITSRFLVTPVITTALGLILINRLMPRQDVRWSAALLGGAGSAMLFELSKYGFERYLGLVAMQTYEGIYGSLAILPVFAIWSYVSWMIVLIGAEVTYVAHHLEAVTREGFVPTAHQRADRPYAAPGRTAARLLLAICDQYDHRGSGLSVESLDERFQLGLARTGRLVDLLESGGFILPLAGEDGGWVPSRPLDKIYVREVLAFFDDDISDGRNDGLTELFELLDAHAVRSVGDLDFYALVSRERSRRAETDATHRGRFHSRPAEPPPPEAEAQTEHEGSPNPADAGST